MNKRDPIGMFDSGVGGISVLRTAMRLLPGESYIFYGDSANAPYGTKPEGEVVDLSRKAVERLLSYGVKAVVIACNTATCAAAATLRCEHPQLIIIGMEPALKLAHDKRHAGDIIVLATPVTLQSRKYQALYGAYGEHALSLPCPGLMELVEAQADEAVMAAYLAGKLEPFLNRDDPPAAVVLGCTHYVFLRPVLRRLLPPGVMVLDGNEGTVRQLARRLDAAGLRSDAADGGEPLLLSSAGEGASALMRRMLSLPE